MDSVLITVQCRRTREKTYVKTVVRCTYVSELVVGLFKFVCCRLQLCSCQLDVAVQYGNTLIERVDLLFLLHHNDENSYRTT